MTTPDRTEELVRAMLERRADVPAPTWLADRTMHAVATARQDRPGVASRMALPDTAPARVALAAALTLLLLAVVGGALAASGFLDELIDPGPRFPALIVEPGGSADPGGSLSPDGSPTPGPDATTRVVAPTPRPVPDNLAADSLAVVTDEGRRLRVRTAPGVGSDSRMLEPVLPAGTRMYIVRGPVPADGYDWYEVQTDAFTGDIDLYGWVASSDKEGVAWIEPTKPACPDASDAVAVAHAPPLDRLACYGDAPFEVAARAVFQAIDMGSACEWSPGHGACSMDPAWMTWPTELFVGESDGGPGELGGVVTLPVSIPPGVPSPGGDENTENVRAVVAADSPEARDCRFLDESGDEIGPRAQAVLECRTRLVVRELSWDTISEPVEPLATDSMAIVVSDQLPVGSEPWEDVRTLGPWLPTETRVYVDSQWPESGPAEYYAILRDDGQAPSFGWVPAIVDGEPTLEADDASCAPMEDWRSFVELSPLERLTCVGSDQVVLDMWVWRMQEPRPDWSDGCTAWTYLAGSKAGSSCVATPEWLSTFSGVVARRPNDMEMFVAIDPAVAGSLDVSSEPTWVQVTGSWEWPASGTCRVRDAATGLDLLRPEHAAIYCRSRFVITDIGPATTSP